MGRPKKIKPEEAPEEAKETILWEPKVIERDGFGLAKNVEHKFNEDGLVDWKAMVPKKFLYVNNSPERRSAIEDRYGKPYEEIDPTEDKVEDRDLIIMLGGIKYILRLRGYNSLRYNVVSATPDYAAVTCSIIFKENFESENEVKLFEDGACAHENNTTNFYSKYLVEAATNRAFCRCVRNFLNINIVSREELGDNTSASGDSEPEVSEQSKKINVLQIELNKKNITWEQLKQKMAKAQKEKGSYKEVDLEKCSGIQDFPNDIIFSLISKLKKVNQ